ncbi:hypothetical protein LSH36_139g00004 [Paralvinella palmiformis]|uniref:Reverse transcriptase domain-containing protein n=1 Tax=Paralvinella palmiformis TaxID=53620 RepID=A0AAD9JWI2_9ANNE|nr:hypothetical protein LSH36_139g00004 [Paralvinella palmiformis]
MIPSARFNLRYTPTLVAVQTNRGSEEHILTIRLLIGIARKTKQELYIAIIDYQKAYDKVNRRKLIEKVDRKGCGTMFLMAMQRSMLSIGTIGNKQFQTPSGVKQGAVSRRHGRDGLYSTALQSSRMIYNPYQYPRSPPQRKLVRTHPCVVGLLVLAFIFILILLIWLAISWVMIQQLQSGLGEVAAAAAAAAATGSAAAANLAAAAANPAA